MRWDDPRRRQSDVRTVLAIVRDGLIAALVFFAFIVVASGVPT